MKPLTIAIIGALVVAVAVFGYPYYQRTRNDTPPVVAAPAPPAVETPAPVAAAPAEEAPAAPVTEAPWTYSGQTMSLTGILGVAAILFLIVSLRVLRQYERGVVFLLGKFEGVRGPGLTLIFVPVQQMVRVSLRTVTMQIPSQKIITKDNVSIDIAAVAYYHISDPEKAVIVIENVYNAINQISQTTVRNVVGRFSLDQLLSDTAGINLQIKNVIDGHTGPWGTQVTAVEIKDIVLPENMQRAMAKEAEAERERRAKIVAAEGEYQAAVKLGQAADIITQHPVALQLRTLQTMAEISVEKNSTIIFPAQFMTTVQEAFTRLSKDSASK
jgi:regulator of protease activity HflC (stomatin/prohibitin superfamily)